MDTLEKIFELTTGELKLINFDSIPAEHYVNFCKIAVRSSPGAMQKVDSNRAGKAYVDIAWAAVRAFSVAIQYIDANTLESNCEFLHDSYFNLAWTAILDRPHNLKFITGLVGAAREKIIYEALRKDGDALQFVPKSEHTFEMVQFAIRSSNMAFRHIDQNAYNDREYAKLALLAAAGTWSGHMVLDTLDDTRVTDDEYIRIAKTAARGQGLALAHVRNDRIPNSDYAEMVMAAMEHRGDTIKYIRGEKICDEDYRKAIIIASKRLDFDKTQINLARLDEKALEAIL